MVDKSVIQIYMVIFYKLIEQELRQISVYRPAYTFIIKELVHTSVSMAATLKLSTGFKIRWSQN